MSDGVHAGTTDGGPFAEIDPRLVVFALANGMDLAKGPKDRRLQWFTEGLERAIVIELSDGQGFDVAVIAWTTGSEELSGRASVGDGLAAAGLTNVLHAAIDTANEL